MENLAAKEPGYIKMKSLNSRKILVLALLSLALGFSLTLTACGFSNNNAAQENINRAPASSSNILFEDDFSNTSSGWHQMNITEGIADYEDGYYKIIVHAKNTDFWAYPGLNFEDTIIEVDAATVAGPLDNNLGVICRHQDIKNFYFFIISSDGYYGSGKVIENEQTLIAANKMQPSEAITQGYSTNHIKAVCDGPHMSLNVNGVQLTAVEDSALTSGDVGLLAGTFSESNTSIHFDNFVVKKP